MYVVKHDMNVFLKHESNWAMHFSDCLTQFQTHKYFEHFKNVTQGRKMLRIGFDYRNHSSLKIQLQKTLLKHSFMQ